MRNDKTPSEARRFKTIVGALMVLMVGIGVGVVGAQSVKSPDSEALEHAAPQLLPATAVVEEGILGESIVMDAEFANVGDKLVPSTDRDGVVTATFSFNGEVALGTVLLEVSGRPIIALPGSIVPYRDFTGGISGDDVFALQNALNSLGYDSGDPDGNYGLRTAAAVEDLYGDLGYEAPPSVATPAEVESARAQVAAAAAAVKELGSADADPTQIAVAAAALALAQESLLKTTNASLTPMPLNEVEFLDGDNYEVVDSTATLGAPALQGLITLASGQSDTLWASVPRSVAVQLSVGTPVEVDATSDTGTAAAPDVVPGLISWLASATGSEGTQDRFGSTSVVPDGAVGLEITLERTLERTYGSTLRATVDLGPRSESALIVPVSAIRTSADGSSSVFVLTDNGDKGFETQSVAVSVLETLAGRASVSGVSLHVGDHVVIS